MAGGAERQRCRGRQASVRRRAPVAVDGDATYALEHDLAGLALRPAFVGERKARRRSPCSVNEQQADRERRGGSARSAASPWRAARSVRCSTAISRYSRTSSRYAGNADGGGLERGDPEQLLDAVVDLALVGGRRRAVLEQQLLGHALVHARAGGQVQGGDERRRRSSHAVLRQHDQKGHDLEVVDARRTRPSWRACRRREQAGDGALLVLADDGGDGRGEQALRVRACPRRAWSPCRSGRRRRRRAGRGRRRAA